MSLATLQATPGQPLRRHLNLPLSKLTFGSFSRWHFMTNSCGQGLECQSYMLLLAVWRTDTWEIYTENCYDFSDCKSGCFSIQRFDLDLYTYIAIILVYGTYLWISKLGHGRQWFFHHLCHSQSMKSDAAIEAFPPFAAENEDCGVPQTRKYAAFEARTKERSTSPANNRITPLGHTWEDSKIFVIPLDISLHLCAGAYGTGGSQHGVMGALPSAGGPWLFAVQQQLAKKLTASMRMAGMAGAFAG